MRVLPRDVLGLFFRACRLENEAMLMGCPFLGGKNIPFSFFGMDWICYSEAIQKRAFPTAQEKIVVELLCSLYQSSTLERDFHKRRSASG